MNSPVFSKELPVAIGSDHAGYAYKKVIIEHLTASGFQVADKGTYSEESCDYPVYAHAVAEMVEGGTASAGILICGSGNGVCMTANKHKGIRAALCWNEELTVLARSHNDANILCLPARFIPIEMAEAMTNIFLTTPFEGGRHQRRVDQI